MRNLIFILLTFLPAGLAAQPTQITVRAKAKDAKFIGTSVGGAMIVVRDALTGEVLAQGRTEGSTGNTGLIMSTPHERYTQLATEGTAGFTTTLDIEEPRLLTIEAHAPYTSRQARILASTQIWLIPGKDISGDGVVLEIPGFIIDILEPQTHRFMSRAELQDGKAIVRANIVMMCGCTISDGGLWDGSRMEVEVIVKRNGKKPGVYPMQITETVNIFEGAIPISEGGAYEFIVTAFDPRTGNTGVDKVNFVME